MNSPPIHLAVAGTGGGRLAAVPGIEHTIQARADRHQTLHETGQLAFTQPRTRRELVNCTHFAGPPATPQPDGST